MTVETASEEETYQIGYRIGERSKAGDIYALTGELGAGKTVFAKGLAAGLSITEPVNSPTFTILQIYEGGRLPLYHFDVYRIADPSEMDEIGIEEYFYGSGVCLVEWADLIPDIFPPETVYLTIEKDPEKGFDYRRIRIEGEQY